VADGDGQLLQAVDVRDAVNLCAGVTWVRCAGVARW
jgi:hypothetical protein